MSPLPAVHVARAPGTAGRRPAARPESAVPAAILTAAAAGRAAPADELTRPGGRRPPGWAPPRPHGVNLAVRMTLRECGRANFAVERHGDDAVLRAPVT